MRIADELYFAPNIRFADLDLSRGTQVPSQLRARLQGYYLDPAEGAAQAGHAFAAGLILVACIDAVASFEIGGRTRGRFQEWCLGLPSLVENHLARRFYEDFRNGLVHEARIKNGGEFSLEISASVEVQGRIMRVNPRCLQHEISKRLEAFLNRLADERNLRESLIKRLREDFLSELDAHGQ